MAQMITLPLLLLMMGFVPFVGAAKAADSAVTHHEAFRIINEFRKEPVPNVDAFATDLAHFTSQVRVCGQGLGFAKSYSELAQWLAVLHSTIRQCQSSSVLLQYPDQQMRIQSQPVGSGTRSIVYSVLGSNQVVKIPNPELKSVQRLLEESKSIIQVQHAIHEIGLHYPKNNDFHFLGLYAIKDYIQGPTLSEWLINQGILTGVSSSQLGNGGTVEILLNWDQVQFNLNANQKKVLDQLQALIQYSVKNKNFPVDMGPNNFIVDDQSDVWVVDAGIASTSNPSEYFSKVTDLKTYFLATLQHHFPLYIQQKNFAYSQLNSDCLSILKHSLGDLNRFYVE